MSGATIAAHSLARRPMASSMPAMSRTALARVGLVTVLATSMFVLAATGCEPAADRFGGSKSEARDPNRPIYLPAPIKGKPGAVNKAAANATLDQKFDELLERLRGARIPLDASPKPGTTYAVPIMPSDIVTGNPAAPITLVEVYEFLCPFCQQAAPTIDALAAKYGDKLRVVSKYMVVHRDPAVPPALWSCAASKQGKYAEYKKQLWATLFDASGQMQKDKIKPETYEQLATTMGLDMARAKADVGMTNDGKLGESPCMEWVRGSMESLQPFNVSATPGFFINGQFLGGAYPQAAFEKIIDAELAKADAAIKGGVAPADYYAKEIIGKGEPEVVDILAPRN